ncbi:hypothetical protein [Pseudoalteromonas nigrifaciens]|uniref:hypothetical protein n=1 Tax=Pseudoalteromonas nigrifaciens TaxID=28109 RepID=UPI003563346D
MKQFILIGLTLLICSCAITNETSLIIGNQRPAITPEQVKLYVNPPEKYEVIAIISADAAHDFMSKQALQDIAIKNLKIEAAKVGANGILLDNVGSFSVGSTGVITMPNSANASSVIGVGAMNNRTGKQASGKAIYVFVEQ